MTLYCPLCRTQYSDWLYKEGDVCEDTSLKLNKDKPCVGLLVSVATQAKLDSDSPTIIEVPALQG